MKNEEPTEEPTELILISTTEARGLRSTSFKTISIFELPNHFPR
jgi:hypothetical protein